MENFSVMITLFIIVILGYMLAKLRYMSVDFCRQLSAIVVDVTCPLLILSSVMGDTMPDRRLLTLALRHPKSPTCQIKA